MLLTVICSTLTIRLRASSLRARTFALLFGSAAAVIYFCLGFLLPLPVARRLSAPSNAIDAFVEWYRPDAGVDSLGHFHPGRFLVEDAVVALIVGVAFGAVTYLWGKRSGH